jgi:hypothetical protein
VAQHLDVPDLQHEQGKRRPDGGDQQAALAGRGADRGGGEDRGRRRDPHQHLGLGLIRGLPPVQQPAADEADAGDGAGQRVRRPVGGDDADHAGTRADQREDPVPGRCPAQVPFEAEGVGEGDRDREMTRVGAAHSQGHEPEPNK